MEEKRMKKVLVLDDARNSDAPVREAFSKKKLEAVVCSTSNEFMAALCKGNFEAVYINADAWKRGRCIYEYFGAGQRMSAVPAVFYNADENCNPVIAGRQPHEGDLVLAKPAGIETAAGSH
jgi:PleD family two-component response regulator